MSLICHHFPLLTSARISSPALRTLAQPQSRRGWWVALAASVLVLLVWPGFIAASPGGIIFVTTLKQKISGTGGCSLQEAIYSANFGNNTAIAGYDPQTHAPNIITTQCAPGSGDNRIILPSGGVFLMSKIMDDADNPFGPTATPIITSNITIEANGSLLQWVGTKNARAFSVGSTGQLTLENAYIKSFIARSGDGGNGGIGNFGGGGGGMGAGGAIYVHAGSLVLENNTFEDNGAIGGNGGNGTDFGGGGGGALVETGPPTEFSLRVKGVPAGAARAATATFFAVGMELAHWAGAAAELYSTDWAQRGASLVVVMGAKGVTAKTPLVRAGAVAGEAMNSS